MGSGNRKQPTGMVQAAAPARPAGNRRTATRQAPVETTAAGYRRPTLQQIRAAEAVFADPREIPDAEGLGLIYAQMLAVHQELQRRQLSSPYPKLAKDEDFLLSAASLMRLSRERQPDWDLPEDPANAHKFFMQGVPGFMQNVAASNPKDE